MITCSSSTPKSYGKLNNTYTLLEKIGKGGTATVFSARLGEEDSLRGQLLAVKIYKKTWHSKYFKDELVILKKLPQQEPTLIQYLDSGQGFLIKSNKRAKLVNYIVFEYAENLELLDYLKIPKKGFGERLGRVIFLQILTAAQACHDSGIIHKDIKTENVMLTSDFQCKLADFGFSIEKGLRRPPLFSLTGTEGYFPPEVYSNQGYNGIHCDLFALGVCLFIIVCGTRPFGAAKITDIHYRAIWRKNYEQYWLKLQGNVELSDSFKDLINRMFSYNPDERLTIEQIRLHNWINEKENEVTKEDRALLRKEYETRKILVDEYRKTVKKM